MASFAETHGHAVDEGNFEALYATYKTDVQRLASYLLRNAADAEDAAQTVFLNVLRALRQGVTPADPRAWLLAITRNVCFSRHRAAAARPVQVELDPEEAPGPTEDETPSADEIVGALARLLPNQRTALILRDFRGVSRAEICELMSLSPVAVEALLTRARASFREELEAGEQTFACAETRALVEQQLDGLITVADRHSLRSHLRHCAPCSTLARAVRSSRSKVASLLFFPVDLISRLAAAFSQAPTVVHVATALTSTAAVATIAIPVAVSNGPSLAHVEGRTVPAPAAVTATSRSAAGPTSAPQPAQVAAGTMTAHDAAAPLVAAQKAKPAAHTAAAAAPGAKAAARTRPAAHRADHTTTATPPAPASPAVSPPTDTSTNARSGVPTHAASIPSAAAPSAPVTQTGAHSYRTTHSLSTRAPARHSPGAVVRSRPASVRTTTPRPSLKPRLTRPKTKAFRRSRTRHDVAAPPGSSPPAPTTASTPPTTAPPTSTVTAGTGPGATTGGAAGSAAGSGSTPPTLASPPTSTVGQTVGTTTKKGPVGGPSKKIR